MANDNTLRQTIPARAITPLINKQMKRYSALSMTYLTTLTGLTTLTILTSSSTLNAQIPTRTADTNFVATGNPIIRHKYSADPAAIVYKDKVYLYTGHDVAPAKQNRYEMHEWLCFSTSDMVNWTEHAVPLTVKDFAWAKDDAWASQVVERNGKFYWYVAITHATIPGKSIGVAVSDSPTGPFKDARGSALITNDMTTDTKISWDDIDPTVYIDAGGQAYLFWGNTQLYYAKLKTNMTELDGPIMRASLPKFTEAPFIHKRNGWYYLSYAYEFPEKIAYAMSRSLEGPWEYKGFLNEIAGNSNTNHQSIIEFKGKWYFIYHNGALVPDAGSFHRSVCIDYLYYNKDGTMKRVVMTSEGVSAVASH
jgi:beta-xylosidase